MAYTPRPGSKTEAIINLIKKLGGYATNTQIVDGVDIDRRNIGPILTAAINAGIIERHADGYRAATTRQPQPAVGKNTGSNGLSSPMTSSKAIAVSSPPAPSADQVKGREIGPAAPKPSTGNRRTPPHFIIDSEGRIVIDFAGFPEPLLLSAAEALALGDFMFATQSLWRP